MLLFQTSNSLLETTAKVFITIWIVSSNLMVILSIYGDGTLRKQKQNWLILSLSTADFLVGLVVMPLTITYEISGEWKMGKIICELWLALDVLFVTASILNICMISLDRYWSVSCPLSYIQRRTRKLISLLILLAWSFSLLISLPPLVGFHPIREPGQCTLSTDLAYVLYSSLGSFFIPVILLLFVYFRIFAISKNMMRKSVKMETDRAARIMSMATRGTKKESFFKRVFNSERRRTIEENLSTVMRERMDNRDSIMSNMSDCSLPETSQLLKIQGQVSCNFKDNLRIKSSYNSWLVRQKRLKRRERQANITVGLILACFILCWLPFFVIYILNAVGYDVPKLMFDIFFWLGYCNSGVNPAIYTIFNREFRKAFKRQIPCQKARQQ